MVEATIAPETVPCGIHTMVDEKDERGWRKSVACGGTCAVESRTDTMVYYKCQSCGFRTARRSDGSPLQAWDGLLKDGTPYEGSCVDESDWRL